MTRLGNLIKYSIGYLLLFKSEAVSGESNQKSFKKLSTYMVDLCRWQIYLPKACASHSSIFNFYLFCEICCNEQQCDIKGL